MFCDAECLISSFAMNLMFGHRMDVMEKNMFYVISAHREK
jgi:hypothetical protein